MKYRKNNSVYYEELDLYTELMPPEQPPPPGISQITGFKFGRPKYSAAVPLNHSVFSDKYAPKEVCVRTYAHHQPYKDVLLPIVAPAPSRLLDKEAREALVEKYVKYYPKTEEELYKAVI
jgi:hypothetical protein